MGSTLKLPVAIFLLHLSELKHVDLDAQYSIRDVDLRPCYAFTLNDFDCRNGFPISLLKYLRKKY